MSSSQSSAFRFPGQHVLVSVPRIPDVETAAGPLPGRCLGIFLLPSVHHPESSSDPGSAAVNGHTDLRRLTPSAQSRKLSSE